MISTRDPELKPCPFCGGDAESDLSRSFCAFPSGETRKTVAIYCTKCTAEVNMCNEDFPEYAPDDLLTMLTDAWNRRCASEPQFKDRPDAPGYWWNERFDNPIIVDWLAMNLAVYDPTLGRWREMPQGRWFGPIAKPEFPWNKR